mmetsp:Transcript_6266/g.7888  ORF Transcript_6266/g.7888 Transcript_6266/m.7888 type:complete len:80 (+) Transcript_6266:385-624(+)|eukprot:CAMPEP_0204866048 /NCGR_PEP_ID=MMETSP1348-20121228/15528_1 /ASSEMBLY_ACC=CAM_ASM_000700 /TAXON_ID=215587 /ORGANISM="Aplanochytrium stocchinoi, Strain GSBS06" /LENGTH=79 /DNA_ID=CAMNT_0052017727 /DNA_START=232 /DNA_END=471 /DNA_ORIENTATION=-
MAPLVTRKSDSDRLLAEIEKCASSKKRDTNTKVKPTSNDASKCRIAYTKLGCDLPAHTDKGAFDTCLRAQTLISYLGKV